MIRFQILFSIVLFSFFGTVNPVSADTWSQLIRFLCVPSISLFELETFGLENIPDFKAEQGISTMGDFVKTPPSCRLRTGKLQIEVVKFHEPEDTGSDCGWMEWASLSIKLDGKEIDKIYDTHGGCHMMPHPRHQIRATQSQITHCETDFDDPEQSVTVIGTGKAQLPTSCRTVNFSPQ